VSNEPSNEKPRSLQQPWWLGKDTKQSSDLPLEPDLQEHQRMIDRALTQTAVRHIAREVGRPHPIARVMSWQLVTVGFVALLIIAAIAVLIIGISE
jgi:hypothetical protein